MRRQIVTVGIVISTQGIETSILDQGIRETLMLDQDANICLILIKCILHTCLLLLLVKNLKLQPGLTD